MTNQANIIKSDAMPPQTVPSLQPGAKSQGDSALIAQNQQTEAQMRLIKNSGGGRRKRRHMRGGAAEIQVPPTPPGASQASANNYKDLAVLANNEKAAAEYDGAKSPGDTAKIQQAASKGGAKRNRTRRNRSKRNGTKRGGFFPKWGCLSGGFTKRGMYNNKSKKNGKNGKYKSKH